MARSQRDQVVVLISFVVQVCEAMKNVGLHTANLILAIDYSKSNLFTGRHCYRGMCLHGITNTANPYQRVITCMHKALGWVNSLQFAVVLVFTVKSILSLSKSFVHCRALWRRPLNSLFWFWYTQLAFSHTHTHNHTYLSVLCLGDVRTQDEKVFPFYDNKVCHGWSEVLDRYAEITPHIVLGGPTSFAPVIVLSNSLVKKHR